MYLDQEVIKVVIKSKDCQACLCLCYYTQEKAIEVCTCICSVLICKVMHVGNTNYMFPYDLDGQKFEKVVFERDLGVFLDSVLKPLRHCVEAAINQRGTEFSV